MLKTSPQQFERELWIVASSRIPLLIPYHRLLKFPRQSTNIYLTYLNAPGNVSLDDQITFVEIALDRATFIVDDPDFKRNCSVLGQLNDVGLLPLAFGNGYVNGLLTRLVSEALKRLTLEELDAFVCLKSNQILGYLSLGRMLYNSVRNPDGRVFDYFCDRFQLIDLEEQKRQLETQEWSRWIVNSRSAYKLVKLELSLIGSTRFYDPLAFVDWTLLGHLTTNVPKGVRLLDQLTSSNDFKSQLLDIVVDSERTLACLNSCLLRCLLTWCYSI